MVKKPLLAAPAVVLTNPKYKHNVGGVLRACSCFAVPTLIWTGNRVVIDKDLGERLPREERMKGYRNVTWTWSDRPFGLLPADVTPVAVEVFESSTPRERFTCSVRKTGRSTRCGAGFAIALSISRRTTA